MQVDATIYKAYDIRGVYPAQLNEAVAFETARAFAKLLEGENPGQKLQVVVGGDMRLSTPSLKAEVIKGLVSLGVDVIDVGLVSTPTFYFAVAHLKTAGGMQVSASHNPAEWNGIKIVRSNAVPVSRDTGIQTLLGMVQAGVEEQSGLTPGQVVSREGILQELLDDLWTRVDTAKIKPGRVVLDAANAMGGPDYLALFNRLGFEVVELNTTLDGSFPAHEADPFKEENLKQLIEKVRDTDAVLGVAPDGDADRIFFTDEQGTPVHPAILRGLAAQIELTQHPGAVVAYDIRPGRITQDMIDQYQGKALVTPVGHSLIKEAMLKAGAIFGGESSGHFFYRMPYGTFEVPLLLTLKLLVFLSEQGRPFSEVLKPFERYSHSGEINTKVGSREEVEAKLSQIKNKYHDGKQIYIDGITVEYPEVWFNVRASNTEPVIRLTVEGLSKETMEAKRDELLALIRA